MILDAKTGFRGTVTDLDTGLPVPKVIRLDYDPATGAGELEAYLCDGDGNVLYDLDHGHPAHRTYRARGRFRAEPRRAGGEAAGGPRSPGFRGFVLGAPACARCSDPKTLPGDDLCVRCRAGERGQRNPMAPTGDPLAAHKCAGCSRQATLAVGDEVDVTPFVRRGRTGALLFERAATVGRRYYCPRCYRPPRLLDPRGDIVQEFADQRSN